MCGRGLPTNFGLHLLDVVQPPLPLLTVTGVMCLPPTTPAHNIHKCKTMHKPTSDYRYAQV